MPKLMPIPLAILDRPVSSAVPTVSVYVEFEKARM